MYCRGFTDLAVNAHEFTDAEKRSMTVLIIRPAAAEQMQGYFGGRWTAATTSYLETPVGSIRLKKFVFLVGA